MTSKTEIEILAKELLLTKVQIKKLEDKEKRLRNQIGEYSLISRC